MQGRRRQCEGIQAALLLAASIASRPTIAQSTLSGERGTPLVPEADTVPAGEFSLSAAVSLMGAMPGDRFHAAPFGLTVGLWDRLEAGIALQAMPRGLPQARGVEQDLRLSTKALLLTEYIVRPAISLALAADHPLQGWDFLPSVIAQKHAGPLLVTGQFGWRLPRKRRDADPPGPFYGAAAALAMSPSTTVMLQAAGDAGRGFANVTVMPGIAFSLLGPDPLEARRRALRQKGLEVARAILGDSPAPEVTTSLPPGAATDAAVEPPAWTGMGLLNSVRTASLQHPGRITFFVTGGAAIGDRATWSVFAGIQIASFDELLQDSDGDGIPDRFDKCPYEPEDWDGYEDEDGCPDNGSEVLKKRVEETRRKAEEKGVRFTTPFPRYRMAIPIRPIPTAPSRGDPRESDPPRAPPPADKQPAEKPPEEKPPKKAGGTKPHDPVARRLARAAKSAASMSAASTPSGASSSGAAFLDDLDPFFAFGRARASPVIPRSILDGRGRGVADALLFPAMGGAVDLGPAHHSALAQFARRAARLDAKLEVWSCAPPPHEPEAAGEHAREIALLAAWLGGLPLSRIHVLTTPGALASRPDLVVLLVPGTRNSR